MPGKFHRMCLGLVLVSFGAPAGSEEKLWLQGGGSISGDVSRTGRTMSVSWPFGSVLFPVDCARSTNFSVKVSGNSVRPVAWTRGDFVLRYRLVRSGSDVIAQNVRVSVKNRIRLPKGFSSALARHEEVHRRLNELAASRIEQNLRWFHFPFDGTDYGLRRAEKRLKSEFSRLLAEEEKLHKDWDVSDPIEVSELYSRTVD